MGIISFSPVKFITVIVYLFCKKAVPTNEVDFRQQIKSSWWLVFYYAVMMVISYLGSFGGLELLKNPWDLITVAVVSLISYYWGSYTALPKAMIDDDAVEITDPDIPSQKISSGYSMKD